MKYTRFFKQYCRFLWRKYIEPVDPINLQLKQALKIGLVAVISMSFLHFFTIPQGKWLVFSAIFTSQTYLGDTRRARFLTQFLSGLILSAGFFVMSIVGQYFILFLLLASLCTGIAFYFSKYGPNLFRPAVLILVLLIIGGFVPVGFSAAWCRTINTLCGAGLALLVSNVLWPFNPKKILKRNLQKGLVNISRYLQFIVDDSLRGNFHRLQRYERKAKVLRTIECCRKKLAHYATEQEKKRLVCQEQLFIQTAALGDLLNKPNSEYMLDVIAKNMTVLMGNLTESVVHPEKETIKNLRQQIASLKQLAKEHVSRVFIMHDINNISYILSRLCDTLGCMSGLQQYEN